MNPELRGAMRSMKEIPKSTDNMDPKSHFVQMYNTFPVAPGVTAHSIIAVKNPNDPKEKWNDGVVEYKSAHIEPVKSELVVRIPGTLPRIILRPSRRYAAFFWST